MSINGASLIKRARRGLIRTLDRRGGRSLLAGLSTAFARRYEPEAKIFYQSGSWVRKLGDDYRVDGAAYPYYTDQLRSYEHHFNSYVSLVRDVCFLAYEPKPGDVVVDVGAAYGHTTHVLSRIVGPRGKALAIEAQPRSFELLEQTVALNKMVNTQCSRSAVLREPGEVNIEDNDNYASNRIDTSAETVGGTLVKGDSLDNICARHGIDSIDFMLMNIEGAERLAIQGMSKLLPGLRNVCIMCHDFLAEDTGVEWYRTKDLVIDFLTEGGFEVITSDSPPRDLSRDRVIGTRR